MSVPVGVRVPENGRQQAEIAAAVAHTYAKQLTDDLLWFLEQPLSMSSADEFTKRVSRVALALDAEARSFLKRAELREASEPELEPLLKPFSIHSVIDDIGGLT